MDPLEETTVATGQPEEEPTGTTSEGTELETGGQSEDNFTSIDIATLPEELQGQYKAFQSDYSKKTAALADQKRELEGFSAIRDQFNLDPQGTIRNLAQQHGLSIAEATAAVTGDPAPTADWEPQTWGEGQDKIMESTMSAVMEKLNGSVIPAVQSMQAKSIEKSLDDIDPMWRKHENSMRSVMQKHPTLAEDIPLLYEMSIPKADRESRATQAALVKMRNIEKAGNVSGSTSTKSTTSAQNEVSSFDDAVVEAKRRLAERG